ncbi:sensor domain-containing diguanylate cyclase [Sporomusa sp.]|uniref:sensor domain-containing diguanylate cyclase n=1 Tax=Sporomusa sp. TaxID=2078658 RepID=UPI002D046A93|nr:FIST N-terminal domain-containing protein [Sporomusa sp.]HWR42354.1 FIST N-terminal domain-containing protein [Sporomusa sp.]
MKTINTYYNNYMGLVSFVQNNHNALYGSDTKAIVVQIFSGKYEKDFLERLSAEIMGLIPNACIIGTTTSGEIMDGQVSGLRTVLSFSIFYHSTAKIGVFPKWGQGDFDLGRTVASRLGSDKAKLLILFATRQSVDANNLLTGIQSIYPNLPIAGGNAGNSFVEQQSLLICGGQVIDSGAVGIILEGDNLTVNCHYHLGWQPIGKEMTITKSEGSRVYTIDNLPAYEIYREYLGLEEARDFFNAIEYPLIVERHGVKIARTPLAYYEDDSLNFAGELAQGETIRLSFGHVEMISEGIIDLCEAINRQPVECIYVYSCESRRGFLQEHSKIETEPLQSIAPTSGFFTHGEYFHTGSANQLLNATMTVLVLSEKGGKASSEPTVDFKTHIEHRNNCIIQEDKVVERSTGVLKALTHLVNKVTTELVFANERLKYVSLHDALTGLYNRAAFEQEMRNLEGLEGQVGVIVCDLDYLKILNDVMGHDAGDKALKFASEVITRSCSKNSIVARIGGDEFAIIVANADLPMITDIRNRILREAAIQRKLNPELPLYLSVGLALKEHGGAEKMRDVLKMADLNMYRLKFARKEKVRQAIIKNLKNSPHLCF